MRRSCRSRPLGISQRVAEAGLWYRKAWFAPRATRPPGVGCGWRDFAFGLPSGRHSWFGSRGSAVGALVVGQRAVEFGHLDIQDLDIQDLDNQERHLQWQSIPRKC